MFKNNKENTQYYMNFFRTRKNKEIEIPKNFSLVYSKKDHILNESNEKNCIAQICENKSPINRNYDIITGVYIKSECDTKCRIHISLCGNYLFDVKKGVNFYPLVLAVKLMCFQNCYLSFDQNICNILYVGYILPGEVNAVLFENNLFTEQYNYVFVYNGGALEIKKIL